MPGGKVARGKIVRGARGTAAAGCGRHRCLLLSPWWDAPGVPAPRRAAADSACSARAGALAGAGRKKTVSTPRHPDYQLSHPLGQLRPRWSRPGRREPAARRGNTAAWSGCGRRAGRVRAGWASLRPMTLGCPPPGERDAQVRGRGMAGVGEAARPAAAGPCRCPCPAPDSRHPCQRKHCPVSHPGTPP